MQVKSSAGLENQLIDNIEEILKSDNKDDVAILYSVVQLLQLNLTKVYQLQQGVDQIINSELPQIKECIIRLNSRNKKNEAKLRALEKGVNDLNDKLKMNQEDINNQKEEIVNIITDIADIKFNAREKEIGLSIKLQSIDNIMDKFQKQITSFKNDVFKMMNSVKSELRYSFGYITSNNNDNKGCRI